MEHVNQKVVGPIILGDAGLTKEDIRKGYVCHICTMDKDDRFVDLAVTVVQLREMISLIESTLTLMGEHGTKRT